MPATVSTPAILLRAVAYGEADRIVTLFGRTTGRVSAVARGARKSTRRFGGGLGMGSTGGAVLRERSGAELSWLESFDVETPRMGLSADLGRTAHAAYGLELVEKLCAAHVPEPRIYDWLDEFLTRLEAHGATAERLRVFELGLLHRVGVGPALDSCVACGQPLEDDGPARFLPDRGGIVCAGCVRHGSVVSPTIRRALSRLARLDMAAADAERLDRDVNAGCRQLVLELLRFHIQGPLKSLEFMTKLGAPAA